MRRQSSYVEMDEVEVMSETPKAYKCRWQDTVAWVPKSQMHPDHMQPGSEPYPGDTITLRVREFIKDRWFEERPPEPTVEFQDAEITRESQKGLKVQLPSGWHEWLPKWAVPVDSPIRFETDGRGTIRVIERIAKEKGMLGTYVSREEPVPAGEAARDFDWDKDDDIPF